MEAQMTDFQFRKLLRMVLIILKKSKSLEEAIEDIRELASKEEKEEDSQK